MNAKEKLVEFMREKAYKPMLREELSAIFSINKKDQKDFYKVLEEMEKEGLVIKTKQNRYGIPEKMNLVVGRLQGHANGFGFVIPENNDIKDIFIPASFLSGALHGDKVIAKVTLNRGKSKSQEGEIIRILERVNDRIVGTFEESKAV